jgi:hypothetical protein
MDKSRHVHLPGIYPLTADVFQIWPMTRSGLIQMYARVVGRVFVEFEGMKRTKNELNGKEGGVFVKVEIVMVL